MNYLAHAYLSYNLPGILVGNMISDFVKGKKKFLYSPAVQKGIALHRAIDEFTDSHPVTKIAKQYFKPAYGLYAGAFVDVVYDHYLANDETIFSSQLLLDEFNERTCRMLNAYEGPLPTDFQRILPYMEKQKWLVNYRYQQGMKHSFEGLVRRAKYIDDPLPAFLIFQENFSELKSCYKAFFPQLQNFTVQKLSGLLDPGI